MVSVFLNHITTCRLTGRTRLNEDTVKILSKYQYIFSLLAFLFGLTIGIYIGSLKGIPLVAKRAVWSIGIFEGPSPFDLTPPKTIKNPVITANDITDIQAEFVADPFMVVYDSTYYMFFEVLNKKSNHGDIGLATSNDGINWKYKQIVIDEPFHLSYPYVFSWKGQYYIIPESYKNSSIRLYRATNFPTGWEFVGTLLTGYDFIDPSIFRFNDKWWLFFSSTRSDILRLYYADNLMGPWVEHPKSPIIEKDPKIARPGGRVLLFNDRIFRFAQDDYPRYGNQVNVFEITGLDTNNYEEKPLTVNPILQASGTGWNALGMHHIDPHLVDGKRWVACVDGIGTKLVFGFGH